MWREVQDDDIDVVRLSSVPPGRPKLSEGDVNKLGCVSKFENITTTLVCAAKLGDKRVATILSSSSECCDCRSSDGIFRGPSCVYSPVMFFSHPRQSMTLLLYRLVASTLCLSFIYNMASWTTIDRANFCQELPGVLRALSAAEYVAVDVEMSGIRANMQQTEVASFDSAKDLVYERAKRAARLFTVIEFGMTCMSYSEQRSSKYFPSGIY